MNRICLVAFVFSLFVFGCKDNEEPVLKVTYEVITTGGAMWYGEFDDENEIRVNSFDMNGGLLPSGWKYSFEPKVSPMIATIHGTADCPTCDEQTLRESSEDLTVNIYINDKLVQTQTNSCRECTVGTIKGMATAWLKIPEEL